MRPIGLRFGQFVASLGIGVLVLVALSVALRPQVRDCNDMFINGHAASCVAPTADPIHVLGGAAAATLATASLTEVARRRHHHS